MAKLYTIKASSKLTVKEGMFSDLFFHVPSKVENP
jgi:hypothetical protein